MDNQLPPKKVPDFCSFRYGLALFLHCCNVLITAQRTCLNLTIVAMVNSTDPHGLTNASTENLQDNTKNPVYNWSPNIQGMILSSIFYGVVFIQIPVGYLSIIYTVKKTIGCALFLSSLLSLLIPPAAEVGEAYIIACRVVQGMAQEIVMIAQCQVWVKWAPPLEQGQLNSICQSGFLLGIFIVLLVTGVICESLGWPMVFYILGASGCALCLLWFVLFYDDPMDHPCISISEKEYITSSLQQQVSSSRQPLPIKAMLKSLPLWAISFSMIAYYCASSTMLFYTPTFINSVLHVTIRENGLLSALPYLFAWIFGILSGQISDFFLTRNIFSIITVRKLFTTLGLLLPATFKTCLPYLTYNFHSALILLILSVAPGSFNFVGSLINALDIAPRYYGFLRAVTSSFGVIGSLAATTLTGLILSQDPEYAWFKVFFSLAATEVIILIFYLIFAKAEIQDWAKEIQETRF
ncbi:sodium-dependent phosphate transport protein 1 [Otolemur garnettii]|uniref:sodium-dependent phosphate transport protein 1 n=1 Tax=Otolemur garnettii TaxID=30611 RepID=UPI0002740642|nr:sodium-dependent phosphate transport protein 1 [Otolemur garnettii]